MDNPVTYIALGVAGLFALYVIFGKEFEFEDKTQRFILIVIMLVCCLVVAYLINHTPPPDDSREEEYWRKP